MQDKSEFLKTSPIKYWVLLISLSLLPSCLFGSKSPSSHSGPREFGKYKTIVFEDMRHGAAVRIPPRFIKKFSDQLAITLDLKHPNKFQHIKRTSKHLIDDYVLVSGTVNSYVDISAKSNLFRSRFTGNRLSVAISIKDGFTGDPIMDTIIYDSKKELEDENIPSNEDVSQYISLAVSRIIESIGKYQFE